MELTEKQKSEGWRIVKFGDVAQEVKASTKDPLGEGIERYIGLKHIDPESLRLARYGLIAEDNPTFTKKFSAGDILFGRRRAYLKKAAVADFDGICSGDITVIAPKGEDLVPDLLPFIVQSEPFFDWAVKHSAGGLSPRTKFKSLAEFEFPLPPRPRQEEMLKILEKAESLLHEQRQVWELSEKTKIRIAYDRMLKGNWFSEIFGAKQEVLPEGWDIKTCNDVISNIQYGLSKSLSLKGQYPILRMMNFKNGYVTDDDLKYINLPEKEFKKFQLKKGDLLFNRTNSMEWVGRTGQFMLDEDGFVFASYLLRLHTKEDLITTSYLNQYLNLPLVQYRLKAYATPGVNQANINPKSLSKLKIPLPPMPYILETDSILNDFDVAIEKAEQNYKHALTSAKKIRSKMIFGGAA